MKKLNLIFDLDDTLVDCSKFYKQQQEAFAQYQHERTGLSVDLIKKVREDIDVNFMSTPDGFSRARFPRSFAATSMTIDMMLGNSMDEEAARQSFELGDLVFDAEYPLCPGVDVMLSAYKDAGHNLFLVTKGDFAVQTKKIEMNGLSNWFSTDKIYIVAQKSHVEYGRVLHDHHLDKSDTCIIGDSIRDDMISAEHLAVSCVWVHGRHNTGWSYENAKYKPIFSIEHAADLVTLIDPITGKLLADPLV